jgi:hypothetical protein
MLLDEMQLVMVEVVMMVAVIVSVYDFLILNDLMNRVMVELVVVDDLAEEVFD